MAEGGRAALWSPEALDDRERIWDYYVGVAGRHTAEKVLRDIGDVIALIEDHPFGGRAQRGASGLTFVYRHASHRLLSCRRWQARNRARAGWAAGY